MCNNSQSQTGIVACNFPPLSLPFSVSFIRNGTRVCWAALISGVLCVCVCVCYCSYFRIPIVTLLPVDFFHDTSYFVHYLARLECLRFLCLWCTYDSQAKLGRRAEHCCGRGPRSLMAFSGQQTKSPDIKVNKLLFALVLVHRAWHFIFPATAQGDKLLRRIEKAAIGMSQRVMAW